MLILFLIACMICLGAYIVELRDTINTTERTQRYWKRRCHILESDFLQLIDENAQNEVRIRELEG